MTTAKENPESNRAHTSTATTLHGLVCNTPRRHAAAPAPPAHPERTLDGENGTVAPAPAPATDAW
eukprot:CAMPEP_0179327096 /NCGR_PEP_ID=MMETSP0797-20121207/61775_1 /TAXON_ID=47934 /ORGANISM="Dinophysis acuminata, Strain DAEP01" /LENGTH=64 /DNA_ID=CAMNT_0021039389 /DNA_START=112 /DNA_END=303 /DNA_ORIENTATION=+